MGPIDRRALIVAGLAASAAGPALAADGAVPPVQPGDMFIGSPKAKLAVIEYLSASCPHCAAFNNDVFPDIRKRYIDTGKVRWVFREMVTEPVPIAVAGFLLARAAGPGNYYPFLDAYFHRQAEMYAEGADARAVVLSVCGQFGISEDRFKAVLNDKAAFDALNIRLKATSDAGVRSTPTLIIGGQRLEGEQAPQVVAGLLDKALKGTARKKPSKGGHG